MRQIPIDCLRLLCVVREQKAALGKTFFEKINRQNVFRLKCVYNCPVFLLLLCFLFTDTSYYYLVLLFDITLACCTYICRFCCLVGGAVPSYRSTIIDSYKQMWVFLLHISDNTAHHCAQQRLATLSPSL